MEKKKLNQCLLELAHGDLEKLALTLSDEDPEDFDVMYLKSKFSIDASETGAAFDKRALKSLFFLAKKGYAPALYDVGLKYYCGDGVEESLEKYILCLIAASDGGHKLAATTLQREIESRLTFGEEVD
ncbi:hypothetical protein [Cognatishimia sp.]|uniref:hypothetical protein n=1 Tax=Cognatishimia sp. TaxID=2211648 RepID=UPI00351359F2|nr:hypothetical protein [Cognatishimia sp.]